MKIGAKSDRTARRTNIGANHSKKSLMLVGVVVVTLLLIVWVFIMGRKAEETVSVVMWSQPIYKNQAISSSSIVEYKMVKAEFEKYAKTNSDGSQSRRIILWEERNKLAGTFAAYPLQGNTIAMITDVVKSRTDNSDTVLYSYPGKVIVSFELGEGDLKTFKTFLHPGDRVNITAIFSVEEDVISTDSYGNSTSQTVETLRQEKAFKDIMIADLLNSDGESVLDLYTYYNDLTTYQQANLDASETWKERIEPSTLIVALTPEEEAMYYDYLSKGNIEFKMSLPQRAE